MAVSKDIKLIQISDSHLFRNSTQKLIGVDTEASLRAVVKTAATEENIAGILATGDLSQDGSPESYRKFKDITDPLDAPIHWIPGNHDNPEFFHHPVDFPLSGRSIIHAGAWQILLLDSVIPGKDSGRLADAELEYIEQHTRDSDLYTLLALHHQPIPCCSKWLDTMILENSDNFLALIASNSSIRAVINGHIHQERQQLIGHTLFLSTPSTCFQFTPDTDDFSLDTRMPGYRRLLLKENGSIETEVVRLQRFDLNLDSAAVGY